MMGILPLFKKREAEGHVFSVWTRFIWAGMCVAVLASLISLPSSKTWGWDMYVLIVSILKSRSKRCLSSYSEIICPGFFFSIKPDIISLYTVFRRPKVLTRVSFCSALIFAPLKALSNNKMCWEVCQFLKLLLGRSVLVISKSNSTT